jgi:hypothetical protein
MTSRFQALILSALLFWALPSPLAGQTTDAGAGEGTSGGQGTGDQATEGDEASTLTRPFRGLFGLGDSGRTGVDVSGSIYGGYDENLLGTLPGQTVDPRFQRSGSYAGANSRLSVNWRGERSSVNGWGSVGSNYYPDYRRPFAPIYTGGIGVIRPFGERNTLFARATATYTPYVLSGFVPDLPSLDPLPVEPVEVDPGTTVSGRTLGRYSTFVGSSRRLSRKATINLQYGYSFTDYSDVSRQYSQHYGSISFQRQLTRHARLRIGYGYRAVHNQALGGLVDDSALDREMHDIDAGVDYTRSFTLSMSRRTSVSFSTGSSFFTGSSISDAGVSERSRTRFHVTGSATLAHEMGRTWRLSAIYARSAGFSDLVFEPVTSDSVSASLSGLIGRRNEVSFRASTSRGNVGANRANNSFNTYVAHGQWRRALTRFLAAQVSYLYYDHDFGESVRLPLGFPHAVNRNGVRAGLTVFFPLH